MTLLDQMYKTALTKFDEGEFNTINNALWNIVNSTPIVGENSIEEYSNEVNWKMLDFVLMNGTDNDVRYKIMGALTSMAVNGPDFEYRQSGGVVTLERNK